MSNKLKALPLLLGKPVVTLRGGQQLGYISDLLITVIDKDEVLRGVIVGECQGLSLVGKGFARRFHCLYDYIYWCDIVAVSADEIKVATTHALRHPADLLEDTQWLRGNHQLLGCCSKHANKPNPLQRNDSNTMAGITTAP